LTSSAPAMHRRRGGARFGAPLGWGFKAMGANWQSDQTISVRFNLEDLLDGSVAPRGRSNLISI
jgi:hypothetical protein